MNELLTVPDDDYRGLPAEAEMQDYVGAILAATYPGYRWRVEAFPHPTRPFFDFRPEEIAAVQVTEQKVGDARVQRISDAQLGYTVKPWLFATTSALKAEIIRGGGTLLEVFDLSRERFEPEHWLSQKRDLAYTGLLILPSGIF